MLTVVFVHVDGNPNGRRGLNVHLKSTKTRQFHMLDMLQWSSFQLSVKVIISTPDQTVTKGGTIMMQLMFTSSVQRIFQKVSFFSVTKKAIFKKSLNG